MENNKAQNSDIADANAFDTYQPIKHRVVTPAVPFQKLYADLTSLKFELDEMGVQYRYIENEYKLGSIGVKKYKKKIEKFMMSFSVLGLRHKQLLAHPMSSYEVDEITKLSEINRLILAELTRITKFTSK